MPFNGSGTFTPASPSYPAVAGTVIQAADRNTLDEDFASGLSNCITRDGQSPPTADINWGGRKLTGLGDAVADGQALNWGQVFDAAAPPTFPANTLLTSFRTTGRVGFGAAALPTLIGVSNELNITGGVGAYGYHASGTIQSDVTNQAAYYRSVASTAAAAFTLTNLSHYTAVQGTIGADSAVTTQIGFHAEASLIGATNNYGFRSAIPLGTNRWNFFADGTAYNHFAGPLALGSTSLNLASRIQCSDTISDATAYSTYYQANMSNPGGAGSATGFNLLTVPTASWASTGAVLGMSSGFTNQNAGTISSVRSFSSQFTTTGGGTVTDRYGFFEGGLTLTSGVVTNNYGFFASSGNIGGTNNYGFYATIAAATGRWNFYANGAASNYFAGPTMLGDTLFEAQGAVTSKAAAATLTAAELFTKIIQYTGAAANLTLPTAADMEAGMTAELVSSALPNDEGFAFSVIVTGSGAATIVTGGAGWTLVGSMAVAAGASGRFFIRKTAVNTFTIYRLS